MWVYTNIIQWKEISLIGILSMILLIKTPGKPVSSGVGYWDIAPGKVYMVGPGGVSQAHEISIW